MPDQLEKEKFLEKVSSILSEVMGVSHFVTPLTFETNLVNGVGTNNIDLSSIDYVRFLVEVEEEYDIIYDFTTVIHNIGDIYNYINTYKVKEDEKKYE